MKKFSMIMAVLMLAMVFSMPAYALQNDTVSERFYFEGTKACCSASVTVLGSYLDVYLELYFEGKVIEYWHEETTDYSSVYGEFDCISGNTYTMAGYFDTDYGTINFTPITKTCP